jgi:hypothetical protein
LPVTGMKSVTDNRLAQLIVSIMKLSRPCLPSRLRRQPALTGKRNLTRPIVP